MLENVCYVDRCSDWEHDCEVRCFRALNASRALVAVLRAALHYGRSVPDFLITPQQFNL